MHNDFKSVKASNKILFLTWNISNRDLRIGNQREYTNQFLELMKDIDNFAV
jgi:hypothetical protein